jgi:hypothetical protein
MGLDMYLTKRTYVQRWAHIPDEQQFRVTVSRGGEPYEPIKSDRVSYVTEQVAYWRKANMVHKWFVDNVQRGVDDCGTYDVDRDQLANLRDACRAALKSKEPGTVLPTQSGFFFGSTEYDEGYRSDLEYTVKILSEILDEGEAPGGNADFQYHSSW